MTASPPTDVASSVRSVGVLHGAVTILFGALLLFAPGRTLTLVAVLAGCSLCAMAVTQAVTAFQDERGGAQRAAALGVALVAAIAGVIVIARPEGSIKAIAVVIGIYLLVMGVTTLVLGSPGVRGGPARLRGALALAAGVALMVWPDVTVGVVAAINGAFLIAFGLLELVFSLRSRGSSASAPRTPRPSGSHPL